MRDRASDRGPLGSGRSGQFIPGVLCSPCSKQKQTHIISQTGQRLLSSRWAALPVALRL